uniref:Peptidoglycan recognition protein family domain-containing protein n=1 Tax=Strigamia maritima TaxID=126957 RepID=T1J1Y9_STRMM
MMIHHTAGASCTTTDECKKLIKDIETYEIKILEDDVMMTMSTFGSLRTKFSNVLAKPHNTKEILSHFFIGGDGEIYEGRGWYYPDDHIPGYGLVVSVSFIGDYRTKDAPKNMLTALDKFIKCFMKKIAGYCQHVFSVHNDHRCTDCPGRHLKAQLAKSKHYDHSKNTNPCDRHKHYVQQLYNEFRKDPERGSHNSYVYDPAIREKYKEDEYLTGIKEETRKRANVNHSKDSLAVLPANKPAVQGGQIKNITKYMGTFDCAKIKWSRRQLENSHLQKDIMQLIAIDMKCELNMCRHVLCLISTLHIDGISEHFIPEDEQWTDAVDALENVETSKMAVVIAEKESKIVIVAILKNKESEKQVESFTSKLYFQHIFIYVRLCSFMLVYARLCSFKLVYARLH